MQLLGVEGQRYVFRLGKREKQLLCETLGLYPLTPRSHHRLSRRAEAADAENEALLVLWLGQNAGTIVAEAADAENQALLEEAVATQKQTHKHQLDAWLADKARFVEEPGGFRFELDRDQIEWLLQVLNDVRVGSWLMLGCPDPDEGKQPKLTPENAHFFLAMELCGEFENDLLEALDQPH